MRCGFARIEITPPFRTELFGYPGMPRICEPLSASVLDPLHARVVYLEAHPEDALLLVVVDLCLLRNEDARRIREYLSHATGMAVERILIACTHTHSAPFAALKDDPSLPAGAADFGRWILPRLIEASKRACARPHRVTPFFRETLTGLGFDRRCQTSIGVRNCWNIHEFPERHPNPAQNAVHGVLHLRRSDKTGGVVLHSVPLHPVVMGKESEQISADWPGPCRRLIERRLPATQAVTVQGASAQVQPWISTQTDSKALRIVGEAVAGEAVQLASTGRRLSDSSGGLNLREVPIGPDNLSMTLFEIGELQVVCLPLEMSTRLAARIREQARRPLLFICLGNGWSGYWMDASEFSEGGYEIDVARRNGRQPADSDKLHEILSHTITETPHATQIS